MSPAPQGLLRLRATHRAGASTDLAADDQMARALSVALIGGRHIRLGDEHEMALQIPHDLVTQRRVRHTGVEPGLAHRPQLGFGGLPGMPPHVRLLRVRDQC